MSEPSPNTESTNPTPGTEGGEPTPPAATPPSEPGGAASEADLAAARALLEGAGLKVVKGEDIKNMQGQRDRNAERVSTLEAVLEPIAVERAVDKFLGENKEKYPDLKREDLLDVPSIRDDDMHREAARMQTRLQEHAQGAILAIEKPRTPALTLDEKNAQIEKLRGSKDPGRFQRMLQLRTAV